MTPKAEVPSLVVARRNADAEHETGSCPSLVAADVHAIPASQAVPGPMVIT